MDIKLDLQIKEQMLLLLEYNQVKEHNLVEVLLLDIKLVMIPKEQMLLLLAINLVIIIKE